MPFFSAGIKFSTNANVAYLDQVPQGERLAFGWKLMGIADQLKIHPNWLMQLMKAESGLSAQKKNIQHGRTIAGGLIQWTNVTASQLGTSLNALLSMNATGQLDYVYKFFKPFSGRIKSYYDLYLVNFFPAAIGKPDDWIIEAGKLNAELIATQNPAIYRYSKIKDGKIRVVDFKAYVKASVPANMQAYIFTGNQKNVIS